MVKKLKALVIGGTGSLGSEVCRVLADNSFDIAFTFQKNTAKSSELVRELSGKTGIFPFQLDLCDIKSICSVVEKAGERLQGMDSLIITSGIATGHYADSKQVVPRFADITEEGFDRMIDVNVKGVLFACQAAAGIMAKNNSGKIVITGSIDGVKSVPAPVDYACCKSALWGLTQSLSKELGRRNILVNMVAPGILEGGMAKLLKEELLKEYIKHCSLKRVGSFSEVAKAISFLAGPKNTYLTGQAIILDGGL